MYTEKNDEKENLNKIFAESKWGFSLCFRGWNGKDEKVHPSGVLMLSQGV